MRVRRWSVVLIATIAAGCGDAEPPRRDTDAAASNDTAAPDPDAALVIDQASAQDRGLPPDQAIAMDRATAGDAAVARDQTMANDQAIARDQAIADQARGDQPGPAGPNPKVAISYFDDPEGDFAARGWLRPESAFQQNIVHAAAAWTRHLASPYTLNLHVRATRVLARGGGTFTNGRLVGRQGMLEIWEPGPLTRLRTGLNPGAAQAGGADLMVSLNPAYLDTYYWIDPQPGTGMAVPRGKTDLVSIVMHEIGHGLGIAGTRSLERATYGQLTRSYISVFDSLTAYADGGLPLAAGRPNRLLYAGAAAMKLFGGPVPLASFNFDEFLYSQNHYHVGNYSLTASAPDFWRTRCEMTSDPLAGALMTTCPVPIDGRRLQIRPLDLAILADIGYALATPLP